MNLLLQVCAQWAGDDIGIRVEALGAADHHAASSAQAYVADHGRSLPNQGQTLYLPPSIQASGVSPGSAMTSSALAARDFTAPQQPYLTTQRDDVSLLQVSDWPGANGVFINGLYLPEGSNHGKATC